MGRLATILTVALLSALPATVRAQSGQWVSLPYAPFGTESMMYQCGETCLGFTYSNASRLLFFDINSGAWMTFDLGTTQTWTYLRASGDLVFALSNEQAVVYSALTSTAHAIAYSGEPLSTAYNNESYGVSDALAVLVTDQRMYVFDSALDAWSFHDYGLPGDYVYLQDFRVARDFSALALARPWPSPPKNVCYSAPEQAFNASDTGVPYLTGFTGSSGGLDDGFAGLSIEGETTRLVGYSAHTNAFDTVTLAVDDAGIQVHIGDITAPYARHVCIVGLYQYLQPGSAVYHMWGYDTRHGSWVYRPYGYDPQDVGVSLVGAGGQMGVFNVVDRSTDAIGFEIFSGLGNTFASYAPYPFHFTTLDAFILGGSALSYVSDDENRAWGYGVRTGLDSVVETSGDATSQMAAGEDFVSFGRYTSGDRMTRYVYNELQNDWSTAETWRDISMSVICAPHVYGDLEARSSTSVELVCYSSIRDALDTHVFPYASSPSLRLSDELAAFWSDLGDAALFDARTGYLELLGPDTEFSLDSVGDHVCICFDPASDTFQGYSQQSAQWTEWVAAEPMQLGIATSHIGWVADPAPTVRYVAYNGLCDSWVELSLPSGSLGRAQGGQTMLVVHANALYAFDPECAVTPVDDGDPGGDPTVIVPSLRLYPGTPTPFDRVAEIRLDVPKPARVELSVYDIGGRLVRTLIDRWLPTGAHAARWDGCDGVGRTCASGVYAVRVDAGHSTSTQRVVLVR